MHRTNERSGCSCPGKFIYADVGLKGEGTSESADGVIVSCIVKIYQIVSSSVEGKCVLLDNGRTGGGQKATGGSRNAVFTNGKADDLGLLNGSACTAPKTCETCGVTEGEVAEHTYGEWETVKEATTEEKGERKKTCTACGHSITEEIPMLTGKQPLSVGAIIAIIVGALAVLGGGAFGLVLFLKKKKQL